MNRFEYIAEAIAKYCRDTYRLSCTHKHEIGQGLISENRVYIAKYEKIGTKSIGVVVIKESGDTFVITYHDLCGKTSRQTITTGRMTNAFILNSIELTKDVLRQQITQYFARTNNKKYVGGEYEL